ncbi:fimbrial protein [Serratia ureilytica]|uniref:fimbrial protein n=1 Tax=Serratia ureilytica TaxID=300181 RepID=UPI001C0FF6D8|nr:fimbrial protein [Serratia ureilytica]MBU5412427.1 fimbrial protein [Serratia ureilytica]
MDESAMLRNKICCGLASLLVLIPMWTSAVTTVTVKVTVVAAPPCIINDDQAIDVDFGSELLTTKIDGSNYIKTVDYTLECKDNTSNAMKMQVQGSATTFDSSALQTNMTDLGVALKANGTALTINNWMNFTYPGKPVLQAVPVKRAGSTLSGGDFVAAATLMVAYQ